MATCITKGPLIYAYLTNGIQTRKPCLFKKSKYCELFSDYQHRTKFTGHQNNACKTVM